MAHRRQTSAALLASVTLVVVVGGATTACGPSAVCQTDADCSSYGADSKCVLAKGDGLFGPRNEGLCTAYPVYDDAPSDDDAGPDDDDAGPGEDDAGPGDDVVILSFESSSNVAVPGGEVQLSWTTAGATGCSLSDGTTNVTGLDANASGYTMTVNPPVSYTLRCEGAGAPDEDQLGVDLAVTIDPFTASSSTTNAGATVTFEWGVRGATTCSLSGPSVEYDVPAGQLEDGELAQPIEEGGTYTLSCSNGGPPTERAVELTVADFSTLPEASPSAVAVSETVTLIWVLENAGSPDCVVSEDLGVLVDQDPAAGFQVAVSASTTFTVSCEGNDPAAPLEATVHVPVLIEDVQPTGIVDYEGTATVNFTASTEVTECRVGVEPATSGYTTGALTSSTSLELACEDADGRVATIDVPVSVRPRIESFSGTLDKPDTDVAVALSWTMTANASDCTVYADGSPLTGAEDPTRNSVRVTGGTGKVEYTLSCVSDPGAEVIHATGVDVFWGAVTGADLLAADGVQLVTGSVNLLDFTGGSLAQLSLVQEVGGAIRIENADSLASLNDLDALTRVLGNVTISECDGLVGASVPTLTFVGGNFTVAQNPNLGSISMAGLVDVVGNFSVTQNGLLGISFSALSRVAGASYTVSSNSQLPCGQVEARYCALSEKPAGYLNQNNNVDSGACVETNPSC